MKFSTIKSAAIAAALILPSASVMAEGYQVNSLSTRRTRHGTCRNRYETWCGKPVLQSCGNGIHERQGGSLRLFQCHIPDMHRHRRREGVHHRQQGFHTLQHLRCVQYLRQSQSRYIRIHTLRQFNRLDRQLVPARPSTSL